MSMDLAGYETAQSSLTPIDSGDRLAGVVSHGSMLLAMPMVIPVIAFLASGFFSNPRYVRYTAVQAFLFQLLVTVVAGTLLGTAGVFFGAVALAAAIPILNIILAPLVALLSWPVALVFALVGGCVGLWGLVIEVIATWKAFSGEPYRMPLIGSIGAN